MTEQTIERQHLSSNIEHERIARENAATELARIAVARSGDYLADPENRLSYIASIGPEGLYKVAQYVNAKMRDEKPAMLRRDSDEKGAFLPALHTPSYEDKIPAFQNGYRAIQEYIKDSTDPQETKVRGVAMATEALIIWVHPFNDGNGRTSRFFGKMIEDGTTDIEGLTKQTASRLERRYVYNSKLRSKESELAIASNPDILLEDHERAESQARAERLPNDIDAMYLSVKRLLENKEVQERARRHLRPNPAAV